MPTLPQWATPERRQRLIDLFERSRGFCALGHDPCENPEHHYEQFIERLIADWIGEDRDRRVWDWRREREYMQRGPRRHRQGRFDTLVREQQALNRPDYYLVRLGVSPLTFQQVALIRISGTFVHLFVEVGSPVRKVSKNKRRKAARYGGGLSQGALAGIHALCKEAVRDWQRKHYMG